ncbi:hypothetical protein TNCV_3963991 [Trichonephila clavipes]|nr:hypothetical protein TNCV_3963991 [Trichonephila clavipes]
MGRDCSSMKLKCSEREKFKKRRETLGFTGRGSSPHIMTSDMDTSVDSKSSSRCGSPAPLHPDSKTFARTS